VQSSRFAALDTASSVAVALEIDGGNVLNGTVAGDGTGNALGDRVLVWVGVGVVELVCVASDGRGLDIAVGGYHGGGGEEGEKKVHGEYALCFWLRPGIEKELR
jgi:hypothetical protein